MNNTGFRVEIPPRLTVYDLDRSDQVSFDTANNCFWINPDRLSQYDWRLGSIEVFIKVDNGDSGTREHDCWKQLRLDISQMPGAIRHKAETDIQKIDPSDALARCGEAVAREYKRIFDLYESAIQSVALLIKSFPVPKFPDRGDSTFSSFYVQDLTRKDVTFVCDDGEVKAHKFVLISRCPSLTPTLKGESDQTVRVEGVAKGAFEKLVKYLYTGTVDVANDTEASQIYRFAQLYQIEPLKVFCRRGYCDEMLRSLDSSQLISPEAFKTGITEAGFERVGPLFQEAVNKVDALKRKLAFFHDSL